MHANEQGVSLVGPGGPLNQLTINVLEMALEAEMTEHLGHEHGQTPVAANVRSGTRSKPVLTEIVPGEIEVPRDRDESFEPVIVSERKGRLTVAPCESGAPARRSSTPGQRQSLAAGQPRRPRYYGAFCWYNYAGLAKGLRS